MSHPCLHDHPKTSLPCYNGVDGPENWVRLPQGDQERSVADVCVVSASWNVT